MSPRPGGSPAEDLDLEGIPRPAFLEDRRARVAERDVVAERAQSDRPFTSASGVSQFAYPMEGEMANCPPGVKTLTMGRFFLV